MSMMVACDDCGRKYMVQPTHIGKRVKCKNCGHVFLAAEQIASVSQKQKTVSSTRAASAPVVRKSTSPSRPKAKPAAADEPSFAPQAPVVNEPASETDANKTRKSPVLVAALFFIGLAIVGSLLGYKYYGNHHSQGESQIDHEVQNHSPGLMPGSPPSFSSSGFHDYANLQTQQKRTAGNLEILTTEVFIYRDRHNGQLPNSLDDLDLHYGGNDPRISPFDKSLGKKGYAFMPANIGPDIDRVMLYDIGELKKTGSTHLVMSKYHQIRTMQRDQLVKQVGISM